MMKLLASLYAFLRKDAIFRSLLIAFLLINCIAVRDASTNEKSRFALMAAIVERGALDIDPVLSSDWATGISGKYYSEKAPGPALFGLPAFLLIDHALLTNAGAQHMISLLGNTETTRNGIRLVYANLYNHILSFLLQVIPFGLLATLLICTCGKSAPQNGKSFVAVALFFGTSIAISIGSYAGHPMASLFLLAAFLSLMKSRSFYTGLFLGCAVLSDYGAATALIPFSLAACYGERAWRKPLAEIFIGGLIPLAVWIWYHELVYGNPFDIGLSRHNPFYTGGYGATRFSLPDFRIVLRLLFGMERGLLATQPWILPVIFAMIPLFRKERNNRLFIMSSIAILPTLCALLFLNAGYDVWDGGAFAGPRLLSCILPLMAFPALTVYESGRRPLRIFLWILLLLSCLFSLLVIATTQIVPLTPLWPYLFDFLLRRPPSALSLFSFAVALTVITWAYLPHASHEQTSGAHQSGKITP